MSEKVPPRSRSRAAPFKPQASEVDKPYETDASQIAPPEPGPPISRGPALLDLKIHWAAMSASQKLRTKQAGLAATVAVLGYGLYTASGSNATDEPVIPAASKLDMGAGLRGDSLETKLRGDVRKILDGQMLLGDRITAIEEGKVIPGSKPPGSLSDGDNLPSALPGSAPAFPDPPGNAELDSAMGDIPPPAHQSHRRHLQRHRWKRPSARSALRPPPFQP